MDKLLTKVSQQLFSNNLIVIAYLANTITVNFLSTSSPVLLST